MCCSTTRIGLLAAMILGMAARSAPAQTTKPAPRPSDQIVYQPPPHSIGNVRVEGFATIRGPGGDLPSLCILAPDHVGLTMQEQPIVFWYLSKPTDTPLVLTLMPDDPTVKDPLLEVKLDAKNAGIQAIELARYNVKLEPGICYQLSLALKPVSNQGAKDVFCSAQIKRTAPPPSLVAEMLATSDHLEKARLLAKGGIFYDALTMVSREIDGDARNGAWHERRASLLDQVGLTEVATFDRSARIEAR